MDSASANTPGGITNPIDYSKPDHIQLNQSQDALNYSSTSHTSELKENLTPIMNQFRKMRILYYN